MSEHEPGAAPPQRRDVAAGIAFALVGFLLVAMAAGGWWWFENRGALEAENRDLRARLADMQQAQGDAAARLAALQPVLDLAARLDPDDPAEALKRAVGLLEALGPMTQEQLDAIPEILNEASAAKQELAVLRAELRETRLERQNLMRRGRGTTFPSCWIDDEGRTQYVFDIAIHDDGIIVRDIAPEGKAEAPVWQQVPQFARDRLISKSAFQAATEPFLRWGKQEECRFFVVLRDETGEASKAIYKELRAWVEGHFYVLLK